MTTLAADVLAALKGKTLATAESCTGGGIGAALTAVPGSSAVYKGGIISYCNQIKHSLLGVPEEMLVQFGAVSIPVARAMAQGARAALKADVAVSVTGLAGPDGDDYGNPVGTVFIGLADDFGVYSKEFHFAGDREQIRKQAVEAALGMLIRKENGNIAK